MTKLHVDFSGSAVLVTGGASGIGLAIVRKFAQAGASLVMADIAEEQGLEAQRYLSSKGHKVQFMSMDVSSPESVAATFSKAEAAMGGLDIAVNNAGIAFTGEAVAETELETWRKTMSVNLDGVFLCMRQELKIMQRQGRGVIINMSSGAGLIGAPMMAAYSASKHGVIGLTRTAAQEYIASGIRINAICPGGVDTPMLDSLLPGEMRDSIAAQHFQRRFATPEEVADMVLFACSDAASYSTGVEFKVNGGAFF